MHNYMYMPCIFGCYGNVCLLRASPEIPAQLQVARHIRVADSDRLIMYNYGLCFCPQIKRQRLSYARAIRREIYHLTHIDYNYSCMEVSSYFLHELHDILHFIAMHQWP